LHRFARPSGGAARRSSRESGQALLELALVAPVLILILAGLVQFALIFETQIGIDNAIREAARRGATLDTDMSNMQANAYWTLGQAQTLIAASVQNYSTTRDTLEVCFFTPTAKPTDPSGKAQVDVRVSDSYRHPLFMPIVDLILDQIDGTPDQSLTASSRTEFHVEQTSATPVDIGPGAAARSNGVTGVCAQ
jgi:Flp pilus assembly protein TadG